MVHEFPWLTFHSCQSTLNPPAVSQTAKCLSATLSQIIMMLSLPTTAPLWRPWRTHWFASSHQVQSGPLEEACRIHHWQGASCVSYRPHTDHMLTTYWPYADHIPTTYQPYSLTTYWQFNLLTITMQLNWDKLYECQSLFAVFQLICNVFLDCQYLFTHSPSWFAPDSSDCWTEKSHWRSRPVVL